MNKIIFCEGKTDATILGYFFENRFGWQYVEKNDDRFKTQSNEILKWYKRPEKPDQELAIWGVGGVDQLFAKFSHIIGYTQLAPKSDRFDTIALYFDHDERTDNECLELVKEWLKDSQVSIRKVEFGKWLDGYIRLANSSQTEQPLRILPMVLPKDGAGDLEKFLVDSLREQTENEKLVDEARYFVGKIPDMPYLYKRRYRSKAILGSVLSVISPDMSFRDWSSKITQIDWQKIESVVSVYSLLGEL